jgi:drug/metabolite transporter (DMT)-like permease
VPVRGAEVALLAAAAVWGFTFPLVKDALIFIGPFEFLAIRFGIATLALIVIWPDAARDALYKHRAAGLLIGSLLALGHWFQTIGLQYTQSTNAGFITGLYVVFTPVIAWIFLRRHVAAVVVLGVAVTTIGLGLLSLRFTGGDLSVNQGDALVLGCAIAYGGQIVAVGHFAPRSDTRVLLIQQLAITAIACTVVMPIEPLVAPKGWVVWNALLATAFGSSVFGIGVQVWGQKRVSPTRAAVIFATEAPFAALFANLLANETLSGRAWIGAALIFVGMLVVAIHPAPATAEA